MKSPRSSRIAFASLLAVVALVMSRAATVLICAATRMCTLIRPDGLYAQSAGNVLANGNFEDNTTGANAPDGCLGGIPDKTRPGHGITMCSASNGLQRSVCTPLRKVPTSVSRWPTYGRRTTASARADSTGAQW
jgi:hypothetical protein